MHSTKALRASAMPVLSALALPPFALLTTRTVDVAVVALECATRCANVSSVEPSSITRISYAG